MISSEKELQRVLPHLELESTRRFMILDAVRRGVTEKPEYMRVAIDKLVKEELFSEASRLAYRIGDMNLWKDLVKMQVDANIEEVMRTDGALAGSVSKYQTRLSEIDDLDARRKFMLESARNGVTHRLDAIRILIDEYELTGPGVFRESKIAASKVGVINSQLCEAEGWIGLAAHLSESEGLEGRTLELYGRYVQKLEDNGKFGLAAELASHKLHDINRAILNGRKAKTWAFVAELYRVRGDNDEARAADIKASMLR